MLLAAPSAIRAQDILARPLLELFHPLTVAKALCSAKDFENLAAVIIRDLQFPQLPIVPTECSEAAKQTESAFREILIKALERRLGIDEAKILRPPDKSEGVHTSYCPRCLQQFTEAASHCPDCGGRPLAKF
jgi:rRNA maturation endonuclease Nob1